MRAVRSASARISARLPTADLRVRLDRQPHRVAVAPEVPARRHAAVHGHGGGAAERELQRRHLGRDDPLAVRVREQRLVPVAEQPRRQRGRRGRERQAGQVEQLVPLLVAVEDQRQALEGGGEVALRDAAPGRHVAPLGGPEGGQVAAQEQLGGVDRVGQGPRVLHEQRRPPRVLVVAGGRELHQREQRAGDQHGRVLVVGHTVVARHVVADVCVPARLAQPLAQPRRRTRGRRGRASACATLASGPGGSAARTPGSRLRRPRAASAA